MKKLEKLVIKYLTNSHSEAELEIIQKWLDQPGNKDRFKVYVRANRNLDLIYQEMDEEKAYQAILGKINKGRKVRVRKLYLGILQYAAVFLVAIATGYFIYINSASNGINGDEFADAPNIILELEDGKQEVLDENITTVIVSSDSATTVRQEYNRISYKGEEVTTKTLTYHRLTVPYGKRFQIELADGSLVFLNAGTSVRFPTSFKDLDTREIFLNGEAYVQVVENKEVPFIVKTPEINVRVLGTRFNVSSYKNERNSSAVLVEGSVAVYRPGEDFSEKSLVIAPGEQAVLEKGEFDVAQVNVQKHIAWTEGKLYFVNDRFENIIKEMERHYNKEIVNKYEELNEVRYTGTFTEEDLTKVLDVFKRNTRFEYKEKDGKIIIEPLSQI